MTKRWVIKRPTIEFSSSVLSPNNDKCEYKFAFCNAIYDRNFTTQYSDSPSCLYYCICVSSDILKMLYDNQYEFPTKDTGFTEQILLRYDELPTEDTCNHAIYLIQQYNNIKQVCFGGEY